MTTTATTRLLDLVKRTHAISDYRVAKLLSIRDASISRWRTGKAHMSAKNIVKACDLAGMSPDEAWEWQLTIGAEREQGEEGELYRQLLQYADARRQGEEPSPEGISAWLEKASRVGGKAAAILACAVMLGLVELLSGKPASAASLEDAPAAQVLHIMANRLRRLRRRWLRFLFVFPAHPVGALA